MVLDLDAIRMLIDAAVTGVSMLGGTMAFISGYKGALALAGSERPAVVAQSINEGICRGFIWGLWPAFSTFIVVLWT